MELTYGLDDLPRVAQEILDYSESDIFLFYGKMGVGKTTLIKELCKLLEVTDIAASPSFGIVNEYDSPEGPIYHFDFYRIEDSQEALDFGVEDYLYSGQKVFVEWPEKIDSLLPEEALIIRIEKEDNGKRHIRLSMNS